MSKIKVMNDILANKIAAGEVVEKIYSVVKELVENSIDAKSTNIKVELIDSGKKSIRVVDDGIGMDEVDARLCFERHATSKIYKDDDLFFINTLGFRGEALPSVASVSEIKLETYNGKISTMIHIKGGKILEEGIAPKRKGTIITVTNLFFNTPARLKYLKSESSELKNVVTFLEKLALSYPNINFTLTNNGYKVLSTTGSGDLLKTIYEVYGKEVSSKMIKIEGSNDDYDISGYICKPEVTRSTRNQIITIINGRVIRNADLNKWINEAYYTYKPDSVYPVAVIKIDTDPTLIDVNIHPTKQDIKFSKIDELKSIITDTIKSALKSELLIKDISITPMTNEIPTIEDLPKTLFETEKKEITDYTLNSFEEPEKEKYSVQEKMEFLYEEENAQIKKLELYPVGIAFGTYIIAENEEGIFLIDQHAAQERVNYEKILKGLLDNKNIEMLIPITIEMATSDFIGIKENMDRLTKIGFELEEFGINTFKVNAHPIWIKEGDKETVERVFECMLEYNKYFDETRFNDHIAATIACKKSIKGNTRITLEEAAFILKELMLCENPYNCPHGRPTIIKFTIYELEKMFKRVM